MRRSSGSATHLKLENGHLRGSLQVNPDDLPGRALKVHVFALDQRLIERVRPNAVKPVRSTRADKDLELDHGAHGTAAALPEVDAAEKLARLGHDVLEKVVARDG